MTWAELDNTLPNGFHDSAIKSLSIDYEHRTLRLEVSLKVGDPNGHREQRDDVRDAQIGISGVAFFVVDPPSSDAYHDFKSPGELWISDAYETRSIPAFTKTIYKELLEAVPPETFVQSFFVREWNSYLHIAATDCAIKWVGVARHYKGQRQMFYPGETVDL